MALPGDLSTVTVTGTILDPAGVPLRGGATITFTPSADVTDATGRVVIPATPRTFYLSAQGTFSTLPLAATDNADLSPAWTYLIEADLAGAPGFTFTAALPSSPSTVDLSALLA